MIRIAIVEDFDLIREDLCELVEGQKDMEVVWEASTGSQAVELAKEKPVDIILMDIEMESIDRKSVV